MGTLPYDLLVEIVSHLSLHDRARCRRVCKSFRDAVDYNWKKITHLTFQINDVRDHHFYIYRKFFDADFVKMSEKYAFFTSNLADFLSLKCPNLQVLYVPSPILLDDLHKLSKSLKFFSCGRLRVTNEHEAVRLMDDFKQLETFYCSPNSYGMEKIEKKLSWKRNFFYHISNPSYELLEQITNSLGPQNIRSIEYDTYSRSMYHIPEIICSNLSCLSMHTNKPEFDGFLSNLISLEVRLSRLQQSDFEKLFSSRKLKFASCELKELVAPEQLQNLLLSLNSYDQLESMIFHVSGAICLPGSLKVSLPPKIRTFKLSLPKYFCELMDASSPTLTELTIHNLTTFEWEFPKLKELSIEFIRPNYKLNEDEVKKLSLSLSKCIRMEVIKVSFSVLQDNFVFQFIIDSFETMKKLKKVQIMRSETNFLVEGSIELGEVALSILRRVGFISFPTDGRQDIPTVTIDQSLIPSVTHFQLGYPVNVQFHTLKSYERKDCEYHDDDVKLVLDDGINYYFKYGKLIEFI